MRQVTVGEAFRRLAVTRLTHFTPAMNLFHIAEDGVIRSSKDLAENAAEYFTPTDIKRLDQHPDMICCNFEYPNGYYLSDACRKPEFTNYPDWVCLLLDAELVLKPGTLFCGCNSAFAGGAYIRSSGQALLDCFADTAQPKTQYTRRSRHHPGAATDLQAEALVPGPVDLSHLKGIVVASSGAARQLCGDLSRYDLRPERFRWLVAPVFFDRDILSNRVRFSGIIAETLWTPDEQGSN